MKKILFLLVLSPLSILAQNNERVKKNPIVFVEINEKRYYVNEKYEVIKTLNIPCNSIDKAKKLMVKKEYQKAIEQLNLARYYPCSQTELRIIDSLSVEIVKILRKQ